MESAPLNPSDLTHTERTALITASLEALKAIEHWNNETQIERGRE